MKKNFLYSGLACFSLVSSFLCGWNPPDPGAFSLEGQLLYLKSLDPLGVYVNPSSVSGEARTNPTAYRLAYSVEGIYSLCNGENDLRARFTYLNASHNDSITEEHVLNIPGTTDIIGDASSHLHFSYYSIEGIIGQRLFCSCPFDLTLLFGVDYSHFHLNENLSSTGVTLVSSIAVPATETGTESYRLWGIGPEVGIDFHYTPFTLCFENLSFEGNFRSSFLVAEEKFSQGTTVNSLVFYPPTSTFIETFNPRWHVMPLVDARVSLNYQFDMECIHPELKLGYATIAFFLSDFANISFQGPFLSADVTF